ncbi:hypothetical protein KW797_01525 [Candidatus Parcubacteria bacterium]|nr:hypothetical protein [Candidatus Parcubacteria bacterium]
MVGFFISLLGAFVCALIMPNGKVLGREILQWSEFGLYIFCGVGILCIGMVLFAPRKENSRKRWYPSN